MPRLEMWSLCPINNSDSQYMTGVVYDDPRFIDGVFIMTAIIVGAQDGTIETKTGTIYTLGQPLPSQPLGDLIYDSSPTKRS